MKRGIIKVLAAVFALSLIPAADASAASKAGVYVYHGGQLQASGSATSHWYPNKLYVNVLYADARQNSNSTYAKVTFYQKTWTCAFHRPCAWSWKSLGEKNAPNINYADGWRHESLSMAAAGSVETFASTYSVCVNVPSQPDPCSTSVREAFPLGH